MESFPEVIENKIEKFEVTEGDIEKMKTSTENRFSKLSTTKKRVVHTVTTSLIAVGLILGSGTACTKGFEDSIENKPAMVETVASQEKGNFEVSRFEESREELKEIIEDADRITFYSLARGGRGVVNHYFKDGKLSINLNSPPRTTNSGDVCRGLEGTTFKDFGGWSVVAVQTQEGEERTFLSTPNFGAGLDYSEKITMDSIIDSIIMVNEHEDASGGELIFTPD